HLQALGLRADGVTSDSAAPFETLARHAREEHWGYEAYLHALGEPSRDEQRPCGSEEHPACDVAWIVYAHVYATYREKAEQRRDDYEENHARRGVGQVRAHDDRDRQVDRRGGEQIATRIGEAADPADHMWSRRPRPSERALDKLAQESAT